MKSLMLLPLLALSNFAFAGEVTVGVAGGTVIMDPLETLDSTWTVVPRVGYYFQRPIGIEVEAGFMTGRTRIGDYPFTGATPRLNMVGRLWMEPVKQAVKATAAEGEAPPKAKKAPPIRPLLVAGIGGFYKKTNDNDELGETYKRNDIDLLLNAGPGLMVPFGKNETVHLRTDLRWLINLGSESFRQRGDRFVNWEWTAGLGLSFGGPGDSDGDGIVDEDDQCPEVAEDRDEFEDADGCPELDNDKDGIGDADDQCPNDDKEDMDGFEDEDGCSEADNDDDGILDGEDACPLVAGMASAQGCPDEDEDGLVDEIDECIDEAGPETSFGCPDEDKDHVPDYRDSCPTEPAPMDADPLRSDGCPHKVFITADSIKILDKVFFDSGKSTIKSKSFPLLDEIAGTLKGNPSIKKVSIEGHTDNTGDPAKNKVLSKDRAASVLAYLSDHEIAAERMVAAGFGQEKPLTEGEESDTKEGRAKNRRVEFHITEQEKVTTVFTRERLEVEAAEMKELEAIKVKKAFLPKPMSVKRDATCNAILTIGTDGMVKSALVKDCVALPRSVTKRTLMKWQFEPVMVKEAAEAAEVTVNVEMTYTKGLATADIDEKSVKPVE